MVFPEYRNDSTQEEQIWSLAGDRKGIAVRSKRNEPAPHEAGSVFGLHPFQVGQWLVVIKSGEHVRE
jgi:hypothetical protein